MPHRAPSPVASENEFDISNALFNGHDHSDEDIGSAPNGSAGTEALPVADAMGITQESNSDSDDNACISRQQASLNRKASTLKGRTVKRGGGFQAMGLNANLLKAITRKGFSVPTPIQRKTIPLVLDDRDVVGMARTGSGKTAAFVVPMIEKLKAHSTKVGARALIMSPSRELALQTLKVVKELGRATDLKSVLLVGGDSLEEQFASMAGNPDIVIATPGRFLHLKVEMGLDLSSIRYVVFDEADRLFEMGFAAQLTEILHALPASRQTLLFSATLPKSLVEFARAGLQEPTLIRLDAESKISPDLQNAFFTIKSAEKEGALLHILHDIIKIPTGHPAAAVDKAAETSTKKRKSGDQDRSINPNSSPTPHSTLIFTATKHHVSYLTTLLSSSGFAVSHAYGSLDQVARRQQVNDFRTGQTNILVVTDVAARGIDIPILANVINYDFPSQPKVFVHRVGRTARAGQRGWAYSLVGEGDAGYLLDLGLFSGRRVVFGRDTNANFTDDICMGSLAREPLSRNCEWVSKILDEDVDLAALRSVAMKGEKLYLRTRNSASSESAKRAKEVVAGDGWMALHALFQDETSQVEVERERMLARVGGFRPQETIFEIGGRRRGKKGGNDEAMDAMKRARRTLDARKKKKRKLDNWEGDRVDASGVKELQQPDPESDEAEPKLPDVVVDNISLASDSELEVTFSHPQPTKKSRKNKHNADNSFRDPENFMGYLPTTQNLSEDRAYGVHSGSNTNKSSFIESARTATMDLALDESGNKTFGESGGMMRWDKRQKKYVKRANDEDGSRMKGSKLVRGESGTKIAASFRSGRFEDWKKRNRIGRIPRVGETEASSARSVGRGVAGGGGGQKRYRHTKDKKPKEADKYRKDFETRKVKVEKAKERMKGSGELGGRRGEVKGVEQIRKERKAKERRREKNARPSSSSGRGRDKGRSR